MKVEEPSNKYFRCNDVWIRKSEKEKENRAICLRS